MRTEVDWAAYYRAVKNGYDGKFRPNVYDFVVTVEEKPVKQIDFSKPLQIVGTPERSPVTVVQEGMTLVRVENDAARASGRTWLAVVDENGKTFGAFEPHCAGQGVKFENVPEEPKGYLVVYWNPGEGEWMIDGDQLMTKARAENQAYRINRPALKSIAVKVPA